MAFAIDDLASVIGHWSADAITGLSDGDPVTTLPESISGWNMTASGTARPLYRPTGVNSLPAVDLDGTDDWLVTSSSKSLTELASSMIFALSIDTEKNSNIFGSLYGSAVPPVFGNSTMGLLCMGYSTTAFDLFRRDAANSQNLRYYTGGAGYYSTATPLVLTLIATNLGWNVRLNGSGLLPQSGIIGKCESLKADSYYASFGAESAPNYFDGKLAEMILFGETVLCESVYIEGFLAAKYGITLPASHPFYSGAPTSGPSTGGGLVRGGSLTGGFQ